MSRNNVLFCDWRALQSARCSSIYCSCIIVVVSYTKRRKKKIETTDNPLVLRPESATVAHHTTSSRLLELNRNRMYKTPRTDLTAFVGIILFYRLKILHAARLLVLATEREKRFFHTLIYLSLPSSPSSHPINAAKTQSICFRFQNAII